MSRMDWSLLVGRGLCQKPKPKLKIKNGHISFTEPSQRVHRVSFPGQRRQITHLFKFRWPDYFSLNELPHSLKSFESKFLVASVARTTSHSPNRKPKVPFEMRRRPNASHNEKWHTQHTQVEKWAALACKKENTESISIIWIWMMCHYQQSLSGLTVK